MAASPKIVTSVLAVLTLAGVTWIVLGYRRDRAPLVERIGEIRGYIDDARAERRRHDAVLEDLQALADRTLGSDRETVDHQLRSRLNRIGEAIGLSGFSVNTSRYAARPTPARSAFSARAERAVRDEIDFVEVEGSLSGEGSLEQALRLVHEVQAEPWPKRIDQMRLNPRDNGARFDVTMRLTTLFLPDRGPESPPSLDRPLDEGFQAHAPLAQVNPFRLPPAPEPPTQPAPEVVVQAPPTPVGPDWTQWTVTGVVEGPTGVEVWMLHPATGESRRLASGDPLDGLELVSAAGDRARFRRGASEFTVRVGATLGEPEPSR
ncbi:MAG: hypothetical protein ACYTJ0_00690 [Planctomycetota bacterium]|jgi:hypothetical protein